MSIGEGEGTIGRLQYYSRNPNRIGIDGILAVRDAKKIGHAGEWESLIPIWGPGRDAIADLQDRDYAGAALNGGMAALDLVPELWAIKGARAASLLYKAGKNARGLPRGAKGTANGFWLGSGPGKITYNMARNRLVKAAMVPKGHVVHHVRRLRGASRSVPNVRNDYAWLKVLPEKTHQALHAGKLDPLSAWWHGRPDWEKALEVGAAGYVTDKVENFTRGFARAERLPQRLRVEPLALSRAPTGRNLRIGGPIR